MKLRTRLRRLEKQVGPPPPEAPPLTTEALPDRIPGWLPGQTYNHGIFDDDPEFRPAWSRYHHLWEKYTQGWSPLQAVWMLREQPDFEDARRRVVAVMVRVLRQQASPFRVLAEVLGLAITGPNDPRP
jgi:hypothetical protein